MRIELVRCAFRPTGTFGRLFLDDVFECYTLEPIKRMDNVKPQCIPLGTYKIAMNVVSPKYRFRMPYRINAGCVPRLLGVPGFDGILIHIGNFLKDTAGCILVGERATLTRLWNSTKAYNSLYRKLKEAHLKGEDINLTIVNLT